jgi:Cyclin, N-terminal domain
LQKKKKWRQKKVIHFILRARGYTSAMEQMILEQLERERFSPLPKYIPRVNVKVRARTWKTVISNNHTDVLFDWMFEIISYFGYTYDTAEVACEVLRLFLLNVNIPQEEYQLAGVAAVWLATKMCSDTSPMMVVPESSACSPPETGSSSKGDGTPTQDGIINTKTHARGTPTKTVLSELTDDSCTPEAIVQMERRIFHHLGCNIPQPRVCNYVLECHPNLALDSYELRAILFIVLVCMIKNGFTQEMITSVSAMVLKNIVDKKVLANLKRHNLTALCKWFSDVSPKIRLQYELFF